MRFSPIHSTLLGSTALVGALALLAAPAAQAQMYSTGPGFYLSAEGRYAKNTGDKVSTFFYADKLASNGGVYDAYDTAQAAADKGFGGKAMLGYRFGNNWDVGLGAAITRLKGKDSAVADEPGIGMPPVPTQLSEHLTTKLTYTTIDFEAGYNMPMGMNSNFRLFGGLRFASFNQKAKASVDHVQFGQGFFDYDGDRKTTFLGIGPRIGANASVGLGGGFNIFGGLSGAVLGGRYKDRHHFMYTPVGNGNNNVAFTDEKKNKLVPNAEGEIGVGYNFLTGGTTIGLQLGYRADAWWGVATKGDVVAPFNKQKSNGDDFFHGPFVRLIATFGAAAPMPATVAPPPGQPAMSKKAFIVFFDFDRSNITTDAQKIINDAAATAKSGNATQVTLTGHTDRSGSEQYNQALSIRRGEAVKAAMIKQGVPASLIVVIGKGESAPLVNTPDGVREPQNRRVEILI